MIYFQAIAITIEACLVFAISGVLIEAAMRGTRSAAGARRRQLGNFLMYLAVFIFIASGITKFAHLPLAVTEMSVLGLMGSKYVLVASIEITSGVLLLIRPLRSVALLFISAHCGGAVCAHLIAGQYFAMVPSAIVLSLCWLGAFLRHPQVLWSLSELSSGAQAAKTRRIAIRDGGGLMTTAVRDDSARPRRAAGPGRG